MFNLRRKFRSEKAQIVYCIVFSVSVGLYSFLASLSNSPNPNADMGRAIGFGLVVFIISLVALMNLFPNPPEK